jgi:hypothetical protein
VARVAAVCCTFSTHCFALINASAEGNITKRKKTLEPAVSHALVTSAAALYAHEHAVACALLLLLPASPTSADRASFNSHIIS